MNEILLSLVTFIVGLVAGHWLAIGRDKRKEVNAAAEKFRSVFLDTIQLLRAGKQDVYTTLSEDVIRAQSRAVIEYEMFLSKSERAKLNEAWIKYHPGPHTTSPGSLDVRPIDISTAIANIEAVLKCATPR